MQIFVKELLHNYFNIGWDECSFCFIIENYYCHLEKQCRKITTGSGEQVTASGY